MATVELPRSWFDGHSRERPPRGRTLRDDAKSRSLVELLTPLASLRLTVTLLSLSLFLVLAGTLSADRLRRLEGRARLLPVRGSRGSKLKVFFPRAWDFGWPLVPLPRRKDAAAGVGGQPARGAWLAVQDHGPRRPVGAGLALVAAERRDHLAGDRQRREHGDRERTDGNLHNQPVARDAGRTGAPWR